MNDTANASLFASDTFEATPAKSGKRRKSTATPPRTSRTPGTPAIGKATQTEATSYPAATTADKLDRYDINNDNIRGFVILRNGEPYQAFYELHTFAGPVGKYWLLPTDGLMPQAMALFVYSAFAVVFNNYD